MICFFYLQLLPTHSSGVSLVNNDHKKNNHSNTETVLEQMMGDAFSAQTLVNMASAGKQLGFFK